MSFAPIQAISGNHVQHGTDAGLYVEFYMEPLENPEESIAQGRPIFVDVEFIKIIPVGDKHTVVCRPVKKHDDHQSPADSVRWPKQYAAFKNQQTQVNEGTPVEQWPILKKSQALMLKAVNVHTVEQLAAVSDGNLQNLGMGGRDLRDKAILYIENAKGGSGLIELQEKNKFLEQQIEALKNQISAIADKEDKPSRGRPKKTEE